MPSVLIVGASRGIGLGLAREYAGRGWEVVATVRDPRRAPELAAVDGVRVETTDVTDPGSRAALAERLTGRTFDAVILNAGVGASRSLDDEAVLRVMHANAVGPAHLAYALADGVKPQTGVVAFITSQMGSIADDTSGGADDYRASKAAQNAFARAFFNRAAKPKGVAVLSLHPGWVKTDMGGPHAPVSVQDSARGLAEVIARRSGRAEHVFLDYSGKELPW